MPKSNVAQLPAKLYELLVPLSPDERARVVQATMILFGEENPATTSSSRTQIGGTGGGAISKDPGTFMDTKGPKNKGETLAVAARFREVSAREESHSKADLKKVIVDARRNFDDRNFARDLNNAKRQAAFFNLGTGRNAQLSYYGKRFVDALPDRDAASKLPRPKVGGNKKRSEKSAK